MDRKNTLFSLSLLFSDKEGLGRRDGGLFHIDDMDGAGQDGSRRACALVFLFSFLCLSRLSYAGLLACLRLEARMGGVGSSSSGGLIGPTALRCAPLA